jgi:flagellar hook protein FlgE
MTQSLITGATGLLAHQRQLDVVANNIANVNTTAYKSQRVLFEDLMYNLHQPAQGSTNPLLGGINPQQIGNGVRVSQISKNFSQGVLANTGQAFDFAIQGDGFFVVNGDQQRYTRDGAFAVDGNGYLVDPANGGYVQRFGVVGEGNPADPGFQISGDNRIYIPLGASVPGRETTESSFIGNLPATASPALSEVLTSIAPLTEGGNPASLATRLSDLDTNSSDYSVGDTIEVTGTNADGSSFSISVPASPTLTVGGLVSAINAQLAGATVSVEADGNLVVRADDAGEAFLSLYIADGASNIGTTDFSQNAMIIQTDGKNADTVESTIQVFDVRGQPHALNVTFEKQDSNRWEARFSSADDSVQLVDDVVSSILFAEDGTFQTINGIGNGDSNIQLMIDSITQPMTINFSLNRFTHLATGYAATFEQDGFPPGNIVSISATPDGVLTGIATNGRQLEVAQLAIANFANNHGLENDGENYFIQTTNSGVPTIGAALSGGSGTVRSGQLETSNVDIAQEFTQLIIAQRGFSANARTITVASEILQELNNLFR